MKTFQRFSVLTVLLLCACGGTAETGQPGSLVTPADAAREASSKGDQTAKLASGNSIPLGRLPSIAKPLGYAMELTVIPDKERFSGHVDIAIELSAATDHLYFHGRGLNVQKATLILANGDRLDISYEQLNDDGVAVVRFGQRIEAGRCVLEFEYDAPFGRLLHGLYKVEEAGESYAFTQMESVYAREAFPGFDEPSFKTAFELSLVVRQEHEAIANTPVVEKELLDNGLKRVRFAATEPMTTYLLAIAVGALEVVEAPPFPASKIREREVPFRGIAIKGKGQDLEFAMQKTPAILEALEAYFDLPYPYAKLDIIAVPDFEAGAMENIGAVTFRERLLLLKEDAPPQQKRAFASVMAHELAHMWFGDLVTMPWWDDIWLNESFATWMAYKALVKTNPGHKPEIAQIRRIQRAMREDALISARQIREPVVDNDGIVEAFDGITYAKGSAVLTMFEQYLGADVFRQGVRDHVRRFAHGSADVNDLIESLATASGKDIAPAFHSFLFQSGIPAVDVSIDCDAGKISLRQSRYLPTGSDGDPGRTWQIPVCLKFGAQGKSQEQCVLLEQDTQEVPLEGGCPEWVLPNANFAGYYHWFMTPQAYADLAAAASALTEREWMSVVDSVKAGLANGTLTVGQTWDAIAMLAQSPHSNVARAMMPTIRYMIEYLGDDPKVRATLRTRAAGLYAPLQAYRAFDRGFVKSLEDGEQRVHFSNVAGFMAEVIEDPVTREKALEKAHLFLDKGARKGRVSSATLETILTVGVQDGGQKFADKLLKHFHDSNDALFRDTALSALAKSRDPAWGQQMLDMTLGDELRRNEIRRLITAHVEEKSNVVPAWLWLEKNFDDLAIKMPERHIPKLTTISNKMCETAWIERVEAFLRPRLENYPGGPRSLNTSLEMIQICAASVPAQARQAQQHFLSGPRR